MMLSSHILVLLGKPEMPAKAPRAWAHISKVHSCHLYATAFTTRKSCGKHIHNSEVLR